MGLCQYLFIALALFAIIYDRMWRRLPPNHPAVHASGAALQGLTVSVTGRQAADDAVQSG